MFNYTFLPLTLLAIGVPTPGYHSKDQGQGRLLLPRGTKESNRRENSRGEWRVRSTPGLMGQRESSDGVGGQGRRLARGPHEGRR